MPLRSLSLTAVLALGGTAALADVPDVTTDIAPVHSLVAQVMGDLGTPALIVQSGASPHAYTLSPSEARGIENADLVVWIGDALTPWLAESIATLAPNAARLTLLERPETDTLETREVPVFGQGEEAHDHGAEAHDAHGDEGHGHDHAQDAHAEEGHADHGHNHEGLDPHAWLDPENGKAWLDAIAAELARLDPDNAETYRANAAEGQAEINAAVAEIEEILGTPEDLHYVVFHDAYQYYETRFSLSPEGAIAISDASTPSPARLTALRDAVQADGVECALAEPQFDPGLIRSIFEGTETTTAVLDPLGTEIATGPDLYPRLLVSLAEALATCR